MHVPTVYLPLCSSEVRVWMTHITSLTARDTGLTIGRTRGRTPLPRMVCLPCIDHDYEGKGEELRNIAARLDACTEAQPIPT